MTEVIPPIVARDVKGPPLWHALLPTLFGLPFGIMTAYWTFQSDNDGLTYLFVAVGSIIGAAGLAIAISMPRRRRLRMLLARDEGGFLVTVRSSKSLAHALGTREFGAGFKTLTLEASVSGLAFWAGGREPVLAGRFSAQEISEVSACVLHQHQQDMAGLTVRTTRDEFQIYTLGQRVPFAWALGSESCVEAARTIRSVLTDARVGKAPHSTTWQ